MYGLKLFGFVWNVACVHLWCGMYEHTHDNTPYSDGPAAHCQGLLQLSFRCSSLEKAIEIEHESPNHQLLGLMFHVSFNH